MCIARQTTEATLNARSHLHTFLHIVRIIEHFSDTMVASEHMMSSALERASDNIRVLVKACFEHTGNHDSEDLETLHVVLRCGEATSAKVPIRASYFSLGADTTWLAYQKQFCHVLPPHEFLLGSIQISFSSVLLVQDLVCIFA